MSRLRLAATSTAQTHLADSDELVFRRPLAHLADRLFVEAICWLSPRPHRPDLICCGGSAASAVLDVRAVGRRTIRRHRQRADPRPRSTALPPRPEANDLNGILVFVAPEADDVRRLADDSLRQVTVTRSQDRRRSGDRDQRRDRSTDRAGHLYRPFPRASASRIRSATTSLSAASKSLWSSKGTSGWSPRSSTTPLACTPKRRHGRAASSSRGIIVAQHHRAIPSGAASAAPREGIVATSVHGRPLGT